MGCEPNLFLHSLNLFHQSFNLFFINAAARFSYGATAKREKKQNSRNGINEESELMEWSGVAQMGSAP